MSESGKNASGQEAFGSKANETLVGESPAVSTADVTSAAGGTGATVASEADKGGTSTAPATEEEGGDLCMADSRPTSDPQATEAGGAEDDAHWCLYVGTPWEAEVVADHRDVDEFKEVSRTIGRVMSVRVLAWVLEFLTLGHCILQGLITVFFLLLVQSLVDRAQARAGLLQEAANAHAEVAAAREAKLQA
jgi:hypothetical protein